MEMDAFCVTAALCLYGLRKFEHNKNTGFGGGNVGAYIGFMGGRSFAWNDLIISFVYSFFFVEKI